MVIMKKTSLRVMLLVGELEGKMHHLSGPKRAMHMVGWDEGNGQNGSYDERYANRRVY